MWDIIESKANNCDFRVNSIPYSRKYWRSSNLVVWPLTERKKYLAVAPRKYYVIINIASARLPGTVLSLEVFEQSREFLNLQEI